MTLAVSCLASDDERQVTGNMNQPALFPPQDFPWYYSGFEGEFRQNGEESGKSGNLPVPLGEYVILFHSYFFFRYR